MSAVRKFLSRNLALVTTALIFIALFGAASEPRHGRKISRSVSRPHQSGFGSVASGFRSGISCIAPNFRV